MATAKVLQTPTILGIVGGTVRIKHPDISSYPKTYVTSPLSAAGTTLNIADNNDLDNVDKILIGEVRDEKTEYVAINGAVTRGGSIIIANTTKFSHELHAPVVKIYEYQVKLYGAATDGGSGTLITTLDIQWDEDFTEYTLKTTDTAYAYYYASFYDGVTIGAASSYVASTGLTYASTAEIAQGGLEMVKAEIDNVIITREWLLGVANDWQDETTGYVTSDGITKDWTFEIFEDTTSIKLTQNENRYAVSGFSSTLKYQNSNEAVLQLRYGSYPLVKQTIQYFNEYFQGIVRDSLAAQATAGATSVTLNSVAEFSDSGTFYVGADTITYTARDTTTNILSGIPASGTGAITATHAVSASVWQGVAPTNPSFYSVFGGYINLDVPISEDYVGYPLKIIGLKRIPRLTSFSSVTVIPFTYLAKYYIAARIQFKKGNREDAQSLMNTFQQKLEVEARRDGLPNADPETYYNFDGNNIKMQNLRKEFWWDNSDT